jgi:hypothetical protein
MIPKNYCNNVSINTIQSNSHTTVYTNALVVDLKLHAKHETA